MLKKIMEHTNNCEQAFLHAQTDAISSFSLDGIDYKVIRYYVPQNVIHKARKVKEYFQLLDDRVPFKFRRRKSHIEFVDTALVCLERIARVSELRSSLVAGSSHIRPIPWAIFGKSERDYCQYKFETLDHLIRFYKKSYGKTYYYIDIHHRSSGRSLKVLQGMSKMYGYGVTAIISVAIYLIHDLIRNIGPDCEDFFDLCSNDVRDTPETIDKRKWENSRRSIFERRSPPYPLDTKSYTTTSYDQTAKQVFGKCRADVKFVKIESKFLDVECKSYVLKDVSRYASTIKDIYT